MHAAGWGAPKDCIYFMRCDVNIIAHPKRLKLCRLQELAVDLLNYLPYLDAAIPKAAALLCSSTAVQPGIKRRLIDVLAGRTFAGMPAERGMLLDFLVGCLLDPCPCRDADDFLLLDCAARRLASLPSGKCCRLSGDKPEKFCLHLSRHYALVPRISSNAGQQPFLVW